MTSDPTVVIVYAEGGLRQETLDGVRAQWPDFDVLLTTKRSPFSYADVLRGLWYLPGDLVLLEQDVVPPPEAIVRLLSCSEPWCTHPHWTGQAHQLDSLGLVKFSHQLRRLHRHLIDDVAAAPDPRYWVRRGWTGIPRSCSVGMLNRYGRRACLLPEWHHRALPTNPRERPSTHDWMGLDTDLARALYGVGQSPHVHQPATTHLHDYTVAPKDSHVPWHQMNYDPRHFPDD